MLKELLRNKARIPWRNKRQRDESRLVPASDFDRLRGPMQGLMERFFRDPWGFEAVQCFGEIRPDLDISETAREVVVRADLPGIEPENVEISLSGDILTLSGRRTEQLEERDANVYHCERRWGAFQRTVALPCPVLADEVDARFRNGVLTVRLKKADVVEARRIRVIAD